MSSYTGSGLDQRLDVLGSKDIRDDLLLSDESAGLGKLVSSGVGSIASVDSLSGVSGISSESIGRYIEVSGTPTNDGVFQILGISLPSTLFVDATFTVPDASVVSWRIFEPRSLEDDLNYVRSDRRLVKGTASHTDPVPGYTRPTDTSTSVPASLANVAGKTTDAMTVMANVDVQFSAVAGATFALVTLAESHATAANRTGVPVSDGADAGFPMATVVYLEDVNTGSSIKNLAADRWLIGRTRVGSTGVSGASVEIQFLSVPFGPLPAVLGSAVPYTWEAGQPSVVVGRVGVRRRLDQAADSSFRQSGFVTGGSGGGGLDPNAHRLLRQLTHFIDETHTITPTFNADGVMTGVVASVSGIPHRTITFGSVSADGILTGAVVTQHDAAGAVTETLTASGTPTSTVVTRT